MARPSPGAAEQAMLLLTGSISGAVPSAAIEVAGLFNLVLTGVWTGTVGVQLSYDGGTSWVPLPVAPDGTPLAIAQPTTLPIRVIESGTLLRLAPALSAGTAAWRISR